MTQAQASLARIQNGEYTPDSAAVGFEFEDGSRLVLIEGEWRERALMRYAEARAAAVLCVVEAVRAESRGDLDTASWYRSYRTYLLGGAN